MLLCERRGIIAWRVVWCYCQRIVCTHHINLIHSNNILLWQMYGFVANRIKNAGKWTNEDESKRKKWYYTWNIIFVEWLLLRCNIALKNNNKVFVVCSLHSCLSLYLSLNPIFEDNHLKSVGLILLPSIPWRRHNIYFLYSARGILLQYCRILKYIRATSLVGVQWSTSTN